MRVAIYARVSTEAQQQRGTIGSQLETAIIGWIYWYNETRLHGQIGDMPPAELESMWYASPAQHDRPGNSRALR